MIKSETYKYWEEHGAVSGGDRGPITQFIELTDVVLSDEVDERERAGCCANLLKDVDWAHSDGGGHAG